MAQAVSKIRSKRTKTRAKRANRRSLGGISRPAVGLLIGLLMWATVIALLYAGRHFGSALLDHSLLAGDGFLLLVGLFACGILLHLVKPDLLRNNSNLLLMFLASLLSVLPAAAILYFSARLLTPHCAIGSSILFLLPVSLATLLSTILLGGAAGMTLGVWVSFVAAVLGDRSFEILAMGLVVTIMVAYFTRNVRKRSAVFKIGLIVALTQVFFVISKTTLLLPNLDFQGLLLQIVACLVNGVVTAIVVLLLLPVFEALFSITTDISLLELSDLGHPLLQRLAMEAPGTYHHSLVVANLAQAAAEEVDGNPLLARVCAYFHDIGKLTKPDFFTENMQMDLSPHDELTPSMSSLVITAHVKEGISLAMLSKLPPPILQVIQQHHGTSLVQYFHHKARQQLQLELASDQANDATDVNEEDYRYQGPKPMTKESAIILLADSVEAASRSLHKSSPGHIEGLCDEIVNAKFLDGQLDMCSLSLEELNRVKRSFVFTLTNMLHARVPYPKDETDNKQQANGVQAQRSENKKANASTDDSPSAQQSD